MIFTGDPISAQEAKIMGLLLEVSETNEDAVKFALKFADKIRDLPVYALISAKKAIRFSAEESGMLASENESLVFNPLLDSEGSKEGVSAFISKRKPDFRNK